MYVSGVTEVEVKSTEEAFEILYKGKRCGRGGGREGVWSVKRGVGMLCVGV